MRGRRVARGPAPTLLRVGLIDTPCFRLRLSEFRGELREELRDRHLFVENRGDPLNLIRVMPAKGRKLLAKSRPSPFMTGSFRKERP
jgi:hypothetical protein